MSTKHPCQAAFHQNVLIIICSKPSTDIINDCILNSYFDIGLKCADLTPVHKAEDTTNKKNYRNISLLPAVSKIF